MNPLDDIRIKENLPTQFLSKLLNLKNCSLEHFKRKLTVSCLFEIFSKKKSLESGNF